MAAVLRITAWAGHPSSTGKCLVVWQCTPHWPPYTFPSPLPSRLQLPTLRCLAGSPRSPPPEFTLCALGDLARETTSLDPHYPILP